MQSSIRNLGITFPKYACPHFHTFARSRHVRRDCLVGRGLRPTQEFGPGKRKRESGLMGACVLMDSQVPKRLPVVGFSNVPVPSGHSTHGHSTQTGAR